MKRISFLAASGALTLTGCGGRAMQALQAVPAAIARSSGSTSTAASASRRAVRFVPAKADPIPARVLKNPLIGEARRFDGATPPTSSWMLLQGQTLPIAQYPGLYAVLGTMAGGDGKTTFALPAPPVGYAIAVNGARMTKPSSLADASRSIVATDSLGPGAEPAPFEPKPIAALSPEHRLAASSVRVAPPAPVALSADASRRYAIARAAIVSSARGALSVANRARLDDVVSAAVDGRTDVAGAIRGLAVSLASAEADAVLQANDATIRGVNPNWGGASPGGDPRFVAANVLVSNAITRDQARAIATRDANASP